MASCHSAGTRFLSWRAAMTQANYSQYLLRHSDGIIPSTRPRALETVSRRSKVTNLSGNLVERQREHFNSIAAHYQAARGGTNYVYLNHLLWGTLLKDIDRFRNRPVKVLEPMCGFGDGFFIVKNFLSDQLTYSGYDYSDAVISMVRQQNPILNVWQADATKYDPDPISFRYCDHNRRPSPRLSPCARNCREMCAGSHAGWTVY